MRRIEEGIWSNNLLELLEEELNKDKINYEKVKKLNRKYGYSKRVRQMTL